MSSQDDIEDGIPVMTKAEFKDRLRAMGMMRSSFCRATMVTRQSVLEWGKSRGFPGWVHSWLILAEQSPEVAKMLGALHPPEHMPVMKPPPTPPRKRKRETRVRPEIRTHRSQ
jgi:hypothetical protein